MWIRNRWRCLLVVILVGLSLPVQLVQAADSQVTTAQQALAINAQQGQDLQHQLQDQQAKVTQLNNAVANQTLALQQAETKLAANEAQLQDLGQRIKATKVDIGALKTDLQGQLVQLQQRNQKSSLGNAYADYVLGGQDIAEMVTRALAVRKIQQVTKSALQTLQQAQHKLTTLKASQQDQQAELVAQKSKLVADKAQLDQDQAAALAQQTQLQAQLAANQSMTQSLQDQLHQAQAHQAAIEAAAVAQRQAEADQHTNDAPVEGIGSASGAYGAALDANLTPAAAKNEIIQNALQFLGVPYVWGGTTPSGFDCSGLVQYCYRMAGRSMPRVSQDQSAQGQHVSLGQVEPGDLLFWGSVGTAHHVAIYLGNGEYIHAPQPGENVKIGTIAWFRPDFARRV
ncbi:MAG: NlpC/P60 family protein [Lactobacillus sp.]|jgi:cell wall-associated NlpC family hydrolase|nr:NlpC/P60 family protein [Lactobacillus sp.]